MAIKKSNKTQTDWDDDDRQLTQKAGPKQDKEEEDALDADGEEEDLASPPGRTEPDSREIDSITDRIFSSVLSRYGWERRGPRIEHVGEERRRG